jgi:MG2 domain
MQKLVVRSLFAFVLLALAFLVSAPPPAIQAKRPLPPENPARGLVYAGLQPDTTGKCHGGLVFKVTIKGRSRTYCTHGPDETPIGVNVNNQVAPIGGSRLMRSASTASVVCDGDGVSGNRVQLIYAHASDVADRYATYLASFQQWAADADSYYNNSAAQTGGSRHVRFVTDSSCNPVIPDVTLSTTGDDNAVNTFNELSAMGYNLASRKYVVLVDAYVYCGISSTAWDDSPGSTNANNYGNTFGRVDAGCWGGPLIGHELGHELGMVQMSAPHSDGNWHCTDGYDLMCDYGASPNLTFSACPDSSYNVSLDCNHDDYFSTNPPAGSYLATHWNSANNVFLIQPQSARIDSLVTGKLKGKTFVATSTFRAGDTVIVRAHAVDQNGADLGGASISLPVYRPNGIVQCTLAVTTGSAGNAFGACTVPRKGPSGTWRGDVTTFSKTGYTSDTANSVLTDTFLVQ